MDKEYREFWIAERESEDVIQKTDTKCWSRMQDWRAENIKRIHVIEYHAYESIRAEKNIKHNLYEGAKLNAYLVKIQLEQWQQASEKLAAALRVYSKGSYGYAKETLAEFEKFKEGMDG